jgi:hypothetical protein
MAAYEGVHDVNFLALTGQISASLTSFSRTVDDYSASSKKELIPAKQEKAFERVKKFRTELADYRLQFDRLRKEREEAVSSGTIASYYFSSNELPHSKPLQIAMNFSAAVLTTPLPQKTHMHNQPNPNHHPFLLKQTNLAPAASASALHLQNIIANHTPSANNHSSLAPIPSSMSFWTEDALS